MQRMLKDGRRLRTKARVGGARKEERREEGRGGDGRRGNEEGSSGEDIRRHSPAALDEICQTTRRTPICSAAYLYHDGGSRRWFIFEGSFRSTIGG